jgi:hypothetical protein
MSTAIEIKPGVYQHYKGGLYTVLGVAEDCTNTRDKTELVIYVSLKDGKIYCRELKEFSEIVEWPDGGQKPRFVGAFSSFKKPSTR